MEFKKTLFFRVLLPFALGGGVLLFIHGLLLSALGKNPLGGYRFLDLLIFILLISAMLIRFRFLKQTEALFWEIFLGSFVCYLLTLGIYMLLSYIRLQFQPHILTEYIQLNLEFLQENKDGIIAQSGVKGLLQWQNNIKNMSANGIMADMLVKEGGAGLVITAFLAVLFRLATFITVQKSKAG